MTEVELSNGEVIEDVTRVAFEDKPREERERLVDTNDRMRERVGRRAHLHLSGGGQRVIYAEDIVRNGVLQGGDD